MTDKQKFEYADAICMALFGKEMTLYRVENAQYLPIVCSVPCKNCDTMCDNFIKTMHISARNNAQVFTQKRDVENAMVLHKLCIKLSPFASRFLHGILHGFCHKLTTICNHINI